VNADRAALGFLVVALATAAGMLSGVGTAYACVAWHLTSPDNALAGAALGFGGAVLGGTVGLIAAVRIWWPAG
jgi:hypothetical protein